MQGRQSGWQPWLAASSDDYPEAGVGPEARRNKYVDKYPPYLWSGSRMPAIKTESRFVPSFRPAEAIARPPFQRPRKWKTAIRRVFF